MFPEEKVKHEVATMRYISDHTSVPVPFVIHWGSKKESPLEVGPFIIMEYIDHERSMYKALNTPGIPASDRGRLDPNISQDKLETLYGEMAGVLLKLSKIGLPKIGSISQIDDFTWEVDSRPLSMPMNELIRLGSLPQSKLPTPNTIFDTSSSYVESLAELHMAHLFTQRNDSVHSGDDCRRKFIARHLFRKLAHDQKLTRRWESFNQGPFKLWCDDFRPANVLIDQESKITGVVDWEFTYAAPVEFSYAPPWWLLLEKPEYWPDGLDAWCIEYERRLQTFLKVLAGREDETISRGELQEDERLSGPMRESWESGDFWIAYAARCNFAFDAIYWQKIDQRFFGPTTVSEYDDAWKERLELLNDKDKSDMEELVVRKLEDMETRVLAWEPDEYTMEHIDIKEKHDAKQESQTGDQEDEGNKAEVDMVSDTLVELSM
jgi:aminoglycoside phosphotransferase (APT) family kinase protein